MLSLDEIKAFPKEEDRHIITCPECGTRWEHTPAYARGDPCNIALIGHWDGWQPFGYPGAHSFGNPAIFYLTVLLYFNSKELLALHAMIGYHPHYKTKN